MAATVLLGATAVGAWWWMVRGSTPADIHQAAGNVPQPAESIAPSPRAGNADAPLRELTIGEYRADTAGLPPIDAPLAAQIPALRDAAARGNATAACRLAIIGTECNRARALGVNVTPEPSAAMMRQIEDNLRQQYADVSLERLPERYRAYAQRRIDTETLQEFDRFQGPDFWGRRCTDAPPISHEEILAALRHAALAGEPGSMVKYASGLWMAEISIANFLRGFGGRSANTGWLRSPSFDQWLRESAAVRRTGLERGDPEMLWVEFTLAHTAGLEFVKPADPIDSAAALRTYAALIGGHSPESTAALGLTPDQSLEADRRSDAWAARARERGRRAEDVTDGLFAGGLSACD